MKTKICAGCALEKTVLFRIQVEKSGAWIFVCEPCCKAAQTKPHYKYGGTWKGSRH